MNLGQRWVIYKMTLEHLVGAVSTAEVLKEEVAGPKEPTERTPDGRSWNKAPSSQSKKINRTVLHYNPMYTINTHESTLI